MLWMDRFTCAVVFGPSTDRSVIPDAGSIFNLWRKRVNDSILDILCFISILSYSQWPWLCQQILVQQHYRTNYKTRLM